MILIAYAQSAASSADTIFSVFFNNFISPLISLVYAVAIAYFMYGVLTFIYFLRIKPTEDKMREGRSHMVYGLIGLTIMFSVGFIISTFEGMFGPMFGNLLN